METVNINKSAIVDMARLIDELQSRVESLELMSDKEFMASHKRAKGQIKKREFVDWNAL